MDTNIERSAGFHGHLVLCPVRTIQTTPAQGSLNSQMLIKLEIEIQGEILQVRDNSTSTWSQIYPGRVFRTQDESFTYDELRGMGNGKHLVKPKKPLEKMEEGSPRTDDQPKV